MVDLRIQMVYFLEHIAIERLPANVESVLDLLLLFFPWHIVDQIVLERSKFTIAQKSGNSLLACSCFFVL